MVMIPAVTKHRTGCSWTSWRRRAAVLACLAASPGVATGSQAADAPANLASSAPPIEPRSGGSAWLAAAAASALAARPETAGQSIYAVMDYGTPQTCNGAVDDAAAIQGAADAAGRAGGIVALPSGHCFVSTEITVPGNAVWFRGSGRGATIVQARSAAINVFHCKGVGAVGRFHAGFSDMQIAGGFRSIWIDQGCSSSLIEDVMLTDPVIGLQINGDDRQTPPVATIAAYVRNVEIAHPASYGIYAFETAELYLSTIVVDGDGGRASAAILLDSHANAVYAERLNLLASQYGLLVQDVEHPTTPAYRPSQMFITTLLGDSCVHAGIYVKDGYQLFFDKPWASGASAGPGLLIGPNAEELEFDDGTYLYNDKDGIYIQGPRKGRLNISGGRAISNGRAKAGVHDGVSIEAGADNFRIDGLSAYNGTGQGYGATQRFGLRLQPGPTDHFIVSNSLMTGNLAGAISNGATGTDYGISNVTGYAVTGDTGR